MSFQNLYREICELKRLHGEFKCCSVDRITGFTCQIRQIFINEIIANLLRSLNFWNISVSLVVVINYERRLKTNTKSIEAFRTFLCYSRNG